MSSRPDRMISPFWVIAALIATGLIQTVYYYPKLPDMMATHFGTGGRPDGWSSKPGFFLMMLATFLGAALVLPGIPVLLRKLPTSMINLPNKDYWLAPENRELTFSIMAAHSAWFAALTVALLLCMAQLVIQANLPGDGTLPPWTVWLFVAFFGFVVLWLIRIAWVFKRP